MSRSKRDGRAIDDLAHTYTALFYYACVAAVFAVAAVSLLGRAPFRRIVLPAALSCALVATALGARPSVLFTSDDVPGIVEGIRLHAGRGARLDLDNSAKWATVWSMAAGVTLAMKRDRFAGFCIGEGWHVRAGEDHAEIVALNGMQVMLMAPPLM